MVLYIHRAKERALAPQNLHCKESREVNAAPRTELRLKHSSLEGTAVAWPPAQVTSLLILDTFPHPCPASWVQPLPPRMPHRVPSPQLLSLAGEALSAAWER